MVEPAKPRTSAVNSRLWGLRARDWAEVQEAQVAPAYAEALERAGVGPGCELLDAGCGAGLAAAEAVARGARVSGIDAAPALLAIARERAPSGRFEEGDLEALPFADATFDVVTGFNAFQYAADPLAALAEARRVLKPGGRVAIVTWGPPDEMEAASVVLALRPLSPPPPPRAPGPFALSDAGRLEAFAASAGFAPRETFVVRCDWSYPDEATAIRGLNSSGVAARAIEHAGEAAVSAAHAAALAPFRRDGGRYRLSAAFLGLIATR